MPEQVGRYQLLREVGRGGAGAVWEARTPDGLRVALKRLLVGEAATPLQRRRWETEVHTLLRLRHPHVVSLLDWGEQQGPFLVMEWVEGETLQARLDREGPLPPAAAADLVQTLAGALEHCHARGVLHRDLKPANVLLRAPQGAPLLTDFGLARDLIEEVQASLQRSVRGRCLGSPGYWPPEQAMGEREQIGPPSDVYGLGGLLYAALCGLPPNRGETLVENLTALRDEPTPPGEVQPGVPPGLEAICLRCLARDPARRYPDASAVLAALRAWRAAPDAATRPAPRARAPGVAPPAPRPALGPVLVALLVLALGLLVAARQLVLHRPRGPETLPAPAPPPPAPPPPALPPPAPPPEPPPAPPAPAPETPPPITVQPAPLASDEAEALHARGNARRLGRDYRGAVADLERSLELGPGCACAWNDLGDARSKLGDDRGALQAFDRALALQPDWTLAHLGRGLARFRQQDLQGAHEDLDQVVASEPSAIALQYRAAARRGLADLRGALEDLDRALGLEPGNPDLYYTRAVLRVEAGRVPDARADLTRYFELAPPGHPRGAAAQKLQERLGGR